MEIHPTSFLMVWLLNGRVQLYPHLLPATNSPPATGSGDRLSPPQLSPRLSVWGLGIVWFPPTIPARPVGMVLSLPLGALGGWRLFVAVDPGTLGVRLPPQHYVKVHLTFLGWCCHCHWGAGGLATLCGRQFRLGG